MALSREAMIAIEVASVAVAALIVFLIILVVLYIRYRRNQRNDYVRLEIEKSLRRNVPEGPTRTEKQEDALMKARFYLRDSKFELQDPLWKIGRSPNKHYFMVKSQETGRPFLMTVSMRGPNCFISIHDNSRVQQSVKKLLKSFRHPYVLRTVEVEFFSGQKCGLITFRPWSRVGSLRDIIYQSQPSSTYEEKYSDKKIGKPLEMSHVRQYGRQILEALHSLEVLGYVYPDLHTGNVIVFKGICQLSDYENILMGNPPRYAKFSQNQTPLRDFGCTLFEMAFGFEPAKRDIKRPPANCSEDIRSILHSIFIQSPPASLEDIISHSFFDVTPRGLDSDDYEFDMVPEFRDLFSSIGEKATGSRRRYPKRVPSASTATGSQREMSIPVASPPRNAPPPPSPSQPPPAPKSQPPPAPKSQPPASTPDRSSLLSSIRQGTSLNRIETDDRSAPRL